MNQPINDNDTSARAVLAAVAELGEATAAKIAERSSVAYSTTNKKLRLLESAGLAGASRGGDTKVRWQLTDTGRAYANSVTGGQAATQDTPQLDTDADAGGPANPFGTGTAVGGDSPTGGWPADHDDPHTTPQADARQQVHVAGADEPAAASEDRPAAQTTDGATEDPPTTPPAPTAAADTAASSAPAGGSESGTARRRKGALHHEVLTVLQNNPDATFTVAQVRRKVDTARHGSGVAAASAGAVYNALVKAVADGVARQVVDKPATFQAV